MSEKPKTYRSYGITKIDDNLSFNINVRWIFQAIVGIAFIVMGYIRIENRLAELERGMESADTRITELIDKHMIEEQKERDAMEERISFFEQELNLNPFSWKKSRRKKK